ncbi:MAG: FAD:protein FMN transferase [Bacteroidota bacterium]
MGTYYAITYKGVNPVKTKEDVEKILLDFNYSVSTYIKESTISRLNKSDNGIFLPDDDAFFKPVFDKSKVLYQLTDGDLNTSIAPLVNYWGFGYKGKDQITQVDSMAVDSLLLIINQSKFEIENRSGKGFIKKSIPNAEIDFSSLAKGYGIDVLANYFDDQTIENYLIDIGGEARARGENSSGLPWSLAINKPKEDALANDLEIILQLKDRSIATSGNYRIYYENEGRKFAHILNPSTGFSALSNLLSASIIADDCMTADGLATAMMVKGLEGAKEFLRNNDYPACLIYDADGDDDLEKYYANGFKALVVKEK